MRTIEVDSEVFSALQRDAEPFLDSPNDVLRRVLGLDSSVTPFLKRDLLTGTDQEVRSVDVGALSLASRSRKRRGEASATRQDQFRLPILEILSERGGKARTSDVLDRLPEKMKLLPGDFEETSSGKVKYRHHAEFERLAMRLGGLIGASSPHGVWEITEEGRRYLSEASQ
jgi:hypothetical protein